MSKNLENKKKQFTQPAKSKLPLILCAIGLVVVAGVLFKVYGAKSQDKNTYFGDPVAKARSYVGEFISMTKVEPVIEEGKIKISLEEVDRSNIVFFEVENNEKVMVPLMAYITPSGRLFAGSSMCEPCRGKTFSLAGEALVCDTCRTTYTVEDHQFISGSAVCGQYPPVNMNPLIEGDSIIIELDEVLKWRTRL